MPWKDCKRIIKGLLMLFFCIMLGVMAAEKQINTLTEYHDFVQACNIQGYDRSYALYFLGYQYPLPYSGELAKFIRKTSVMPEKGYEVLGQADKWLSFIRCQGVKRAYQLKKQCEDTWQQMIFELKNY